MAKTDVAVADKNLPATDSVYYADSTGFEESSADSFAIPFIRILQSNSPEVKKSDGAYIKGAEEGMFINSVTKTLYGESGIEVIPCYYTQRYIEYGLREKGGGFFGEYMPNDPIINTTTKDEKNRDILPNGHQLVDSRNHYIMVRNADGSLSPAIISLSSTQIRESKNWMSQMQGIKQKNPNTGQFEISPMFSNVFLLQTKPQSNEKGSWFGIKISCVGKVSPSEFEEAKAFNMSVRQGTAKANRSEGQEQF